MHQYYKYNKGYLENLKPKKYFSIVVIIFIIFIIFLIFSYQYHISQYLDTKLLVSCDQKTCHYYIYSPMSDTKKIIKNKNIIIDKINYSYTVLSIGELEYDDVYKMNYQLIELNLKLTNKYKTNNLYLDVKIKTKEEKLITIIKNTILEKE